MAGPLSGIRVVETPGEIRWPGRALGADTDAVLTEVLGLTAEQVEELRVRGMLGPAGDAF